ncbi:EthD family reductase [Neptuniibacter sp. CAU 1671]|uniref:EthD family reductase n=1 Tax=Neptuniibacter sp. CAU 1671 TaxID=3032593 RepID=UPI0023DC3166|nr:EthD family reductase [Neptuniibacter sp. CAU 1671]MDF2181624.1 EthD family reductase [Neptuniibacter sp. CAU 1671]
MIKVSVLYANEAGKPFDMDYYCNNHMPMVQDRLGPTLKGSAVEGGIAGGEPGSAAPYIAMGHLYFESVEDFQNSFGPHAEEIMGDIPNYTDIQPSIQISEVKL